MASVTCVWQTNAELGEGPLWVAEKNSIYWVDIGKRQVHRLNVSSGEQQSWTFPVAVTSLAVRQGGGFIGTIPDGFATINFAAQTIRPIVLPEAHLPGNRFNDGKVDGDGRYWAGTMDKQAKQATGSLYRLDPDQTLHQMDRPYIISNGPAFNADGQTMYHTDSVAKTIYAFDLHNDGKMGRKRPFLQLTDPAEGAPDGMTIDSENCLWLAHYGGARLTRYSPTGKALQVVPLPVPNVTSCTFGGQNLDTLYITTACQGMNPAELEQHPLAGSLFAYQPGTTGLPTPNFAG